MSPQLQKLFEEARELSAKDRVDLANKLLESTNDDFLDEDSDDNWPAGYSAELAAEVREREAELDSGAVKPIQHADAMRLMFGNPDG